MNKIIEIVPNSIAEEIGLVAGDILISVNDRQIIDVLDYRFAISAEKLSLELQRHDGEIWELEIEKDEMDDLGLVFDGIMDDVRACHNSCIFCFMDQLPKDMRQTLYFKDDDLRLSFLSGNYVTLTNITDEEADRIANYHLSPLHISVHSTDANLRTQLLGNPKAADLFDHLKRFRAAGIVMHYQIVLCKGVNDSTLEETISDLLRFQDAATVKFSSISVVPVGLTKHRHGLYYIEPFTKEDAIKIINQVQYWQEVAKKILDTNFVYCSDEWYIKADLPFPPYEHYESFPQLDNGVGMSVLFERNFNPEGFSADFGVVTGEAASWLISKLFPKQNIYVVKNNFFGDTVTVSGLLTGQDIVEQIGENAKHDGCQGLYLPKNMFRDELTLDDMHKNDLEQALGLPITLAG
ncbi:MAG: DUF512 domain-containing protein [Turicibacter sp.]|nr:DUF512 domain-containing protein [Turicibacter sp.]